jgi:hypothetical protein
MEKFGEERQLPERGDGGLRVPLNVDPATKRVHGNGAGERY